MVSQLIFEPRNAPAKSTQLGQSGSTSILARAHLQNQTAFNFSMILMHLPSEEIWSGPKSRKSKRVEITQPN